MTLHLAALLWQGATPVPVLFLVLEVSWGVVQLRALLVGQHRPVPAALAEKVAEIGGRRVELNCAV